MKQNVNFQPHSFREELQEKMKRTREELQNRMEQTRRNFLKDIGGNNDDEWGTGATKRKTPRKDSDEDWMDDLDPEVRLQEMNRRRAGRMVLVFFVPMLLMLIGSLYFSFYTDTQEKKGVEVEGVNGVVYDSYQSACEVGDFTAAYAYLDKLQKKIASIDTESTRERRKEELKEGKEYVFKQECLYLVSLNTQEAAQRIVYLLSTNSKNLEPYRRSEFERELYDLAQKTGNEYVVQLFSQFQ